MDQDKLKEVEEYFKEDLVDLESEMKKSEEIFTLIKKNIDRIERADSKGAYRYLIEHFKNIIALQSQKQGLLKDKVSLKKIILDFVENNTESGSNDRKELMEAVKDLIDMSKEQGAQKASKEKINIPEISDEELDAKIDEELGEDV